MESHNLPVADMLGIIKRQINVATMFKCIFFKFLQINVMIYIIC